MSLLDDAFEHHAWATVRLIDALCELSHDQVGALVPGTDRSILRTLWHLVGSDSFYLNILSQGAVPSMNPDAMSLGELRSVVVRNEAAWQRFLAADPQPTESVREVDDRDGFQRDAMPEEI